MTIEVQASDITQDGSIKLTVDGKTITFVKESDLGAVKAQLKDRDGEVSTLQTSLASANVKVDESHQDVLKERASKKTFEEEAGKSATLSTEVEGLKTKVADLEKVGGERDTKLTERLRGILTTGYKIDGEKIKDMALDALEQTERTLILTGVTPTPAKYDGGGGGGGGADDLKDKSPLALAAMGYENSNKK
ncbi:hypothetical protein LCGC14_1521890 [marine sediment metagenome]|uniref:Uncharacterized protein n=1 Tax=marine sediment metagenome TaxID=412755 RepID=A0A0F9IYM4_9ZZZZ